MQRILKILGLTVVFALCSLGILMLASHIAFISPVEITILSSIALGAIWFLIYKGLMKLV